MKSMIKQNAMVLNAELEWFYQVLDTRLKLHFGHDCQYEDILQLKSPELDAKASMYGEFINHYDFDSTERIVLIIGMLPHIRPQMLDVFFSKNGNTDKNITEFGGRIDSAYKGFLPTGETAIFILAGDDIEKRFIYSQLFETDHFFAQHNILKLEDVQANAPYVSGFISIVKEVMDLITTGIVRVPHFGIDFPARNIETAMEWKDLVLDSDVMGQVLEIKTWIEFGDKLLYDYGLGKKIKPGYRSLFYGPSGTGKTLTATLLGKITGHDVFRIDLSLVISKYIGETEKNLEKVFQKADKRRWILFFDEADALFGKRTNISDAHDRFANQEVSYLLQRVEDYTGVVILASNMKSNLDEAFTRRFQSIIYFPMPKKRERYSLWKDAFSEKTKLEEKVSLSEIAEKYELSGGSIVNVIRYSTLMALKHNRKVITLNDIQTGLRREFQKEGKTF